jgi:putative Mg2+ transporter-C (MgtC) family protein
MAFAFEVPDEALVRLLVAVVLGAAVGVEREVNDQPAGLRTHIAVCLGAAIFGIVSTLGFDEFVVTDRNSTNVNVDVTRVASQVVVGIGFLGAGVIFRTKESVKNLTTAASMWVTCAIGLTVGVGDLATAAAATLVLVAVLAALLPLRNLLRRKFLRPTRDVRVRLREGVPVDSVVGALTAIDGLESFDLRIAKVEGLATVSVTLRAEPGADIDALVTPIALRDDVEEFGLTTELDA